ncbi:hypothetical protein [Desulforhabdus amnigena]|uniref:Uncharacterized protein n=1 Tax=Desulforhabdus amnigena TaxID=40218 RepID=A0A9W6FR75_9BACT|nr:hypothetical protein [Desulforhabdus amnigena]GLI33257.1 hypothetical protein DAMNIGENAA_06900 [Desulforhabdus amnigena]
MPDEFLCRVGVFLLQRIRQKDPYIAFVEVALVQILQGLEVYLKLGEDRLRKGDRSVLPAFPVMNRQDFRIEIEALHPRRSRHLLQFTEKMGKAVGPCIVEVILFAEIQIIAQPLQVGCKRIVRNRPVPQSFHELCPQSRMDVEHIELSSFRISFHFS